MASSLKHILKSQAWISDLNSGLKDRLLNLEARRIARRFGDAHSIDGRQPDEHILADYFRHCYSETALFHVRPAHIYLLGTYRDHEAFGFIQALEKIGRLTVYHDPDGTYGINKFADPQGRPAIQQENSHIVDEIRRTHKDSPISFVIGTLLASTISLAEIKAIRAMGIPVLNIAMDDRLPHNWRKTNGIQLGAIGLSDAVDLTLQTTPEYIPRYIARGNHCAYWPFGSDPDIFKPAAKKDIDVVFVGNNYGKRGKLVSNIQKAGINIECFGTGFANGHIPGAKVPELFSRAKIVLGTGLIGHSSSITTLKLRDFDAPMSGALYITSYNPDLERHFVLGEEIITYGNIGTCVNEIRYFLANPQRREKVARAGREKALAMHSWDTRMAQLQKWLSLA